MDNSAMQTTVQLTGLLSVATAQAATFWCVLHTMYKLQLVVFKCLNRSLHPIMCLASNISILCLSSQSTMDSLLWWHVDPITPSSSQGGVSSSHGDWHQAESWVTVRLPLTSMCLGRYVPCPHGSFLFTVCASTSFIPKDHCTYTLRTAQHPPKMRVISFPFIAILYVTYTCCKASDHEQVASLNRTRIVSVCAGGNHTLAISEAGELWACGRGRHGQLGVGTFEDQTLLRKVTTLQCALRL